ncbi:MAG: four helix bundle protein [Candidatus Omnitrophota bacterium]
MIKLTVLSSSQGQSFSDRGPEKKFDLEDRTLQFSKDCADLCQAFIKDIIRAEFVTQLIRSSSLVGASYREASEAVSRKEFFHRIGIARRESKESGYWLRLLRHSNREQGNQIDRLIDESDQLLRIFSSISKGDH